MGKRGLVCIKGDLSLQGEESQDIKGVEKNVIPVYPIEPMDHGW